MIPTLLLALALNQYPPPNQCELSPAIINIFLWARDCPKHEVRFEFRDDGTFRVVCVHVNPKPSKLYPKR